MTSSFSSAEVESSEKRILLPATCAVSNVKSELVSSQLKHAVSTVVSQSLDNSSNNTISLVLQANGTSVPSCVKLSLPPNVCFDSNFSLLSGLSSSGSSNVFCDSSSYVTGALSFDTNNDPSLSQAIDLPISDTSPKMSRFDHQPISSNWDAAAVSSERQSDAINSRTRVSPTSMTGSFNCDHSSNQMSSGGESDDEFNNTNGSAEPTGLELKMAKLDEVDKDIYIDTKDLCLRIAYELKHHSIPQVNFAEKILGRSQGTLSDLLRNPKPWNKLKSGRDTFRRMYAWLRMPFDRRLAVLELGKHVVGSDDPKFFFDDGLSAPEMTPTKNIKKPRLVFTDIQKRTLQAIFKETHRPSKEMQKTIADHLGLDISTVQNFFMNARRRCRDRFPPDQPREGQVVRRVSPPPAGSVSAERPMGNGSHGTRRSVRGPLNSASLALKVNGGRRVRSNGTAPKSRRIAAAQQPDLEPSESALVVMQEELPHDAFDFDDDEDTISLFGENLGDALNDPDLDFHLDMPSTSSHPQVYADIMHDFPMDDLMDTGQPDHHGGSTSSSQHVQSPTWPIAQSIPPAILASLKASKRSKSSQKSQPGQTFFKEMTVRPSVVDIVETVARGGNFPIMASALQQPAQSNFDVEERLMSHCPVKPGSPRDRNFYAYIFPAVSTSHAASTDPPLCSSSARGSLPLIDTFISGTMHHDIICSSNSSHSSVDNVNECYTSLATMLPPGAVELASGGPGGRSVASPAHAVL